jgi:hypothetical protein
MALYFFTGFEGCSNSMSVNQLLDDSHHTSIIYNSSNGYNSSKCLGGYSGFAVDKNLPSGLKTVCAGFHKRNNRHMDQQTENYYYLNTFRFIVAGSTPIFVQCYTTGWKAFRGTYSTLLGSSLNTGYLYDSNSINHFECKLFSNASTGYIQVKVNGSVVLNLTGINTDGGDITKVMWCSSGTGSSFYMDNLYVADDFQGELYSQVLYPNADGDVNQFTPSTGVDNYAMVDEASIDNDVTILESNNVGDKELFGYQPLTLNNNTIKGVTLVTYARKTSGVARSLQHMSKQDSVERNHDSKSLNLEWIDGHGYALIDTFGLCPDDTSWTVSKLNAIQWGFILNG